MAAERKRNHHPGCTMGSSRELLHLTERPEQAPDRSDGHDPRPRVRQSTTPLGRTRCHGDPMPAERSSGRAAQQQQQQPSGTRTSRSTECACRVAQRGRRGCQPGRQRRPRVPCRGIHRGSPPGLNQGRLDRRRGAGRHRPARTTRRAERSWRAHARHAQPLGPRPTMARSPAHRPRGAACSPAAPSGCKAAAPHRPGGPAGTPRTSARRP